MRPNLSTPPSVTSSATRRCFKCGSDRHLFKDCDQKGKAYSPQLQPSRNESQRSIPPRAHRCVVGDGTVSVPKGATAKEAETPSDVIRLNNDKITSSVTAENNFCGYVGLQPAPRVGPNQRRITDCLLSECDVDTVVSVCNNVESYGNHVIKQAVEANN